MSDLTEKFTALESQLSTEHSALITALGPLADIKTGIDASNAALAALASALDTALTNIFNTLDTINNNGATNTRAIIAALQAAQCPCNPDAPVIPLPPSGDTTTLTGADLCKRLQFFTDLFRFCFGVNLQAFLASAGYMSSGAISSTLASCLADKSISTGQLSAGVPASTIAAIQSAVEAAIGLDGLSSVSAGLLSFFNDDAHWSDIVSSLYDASSASAGATAFVDAVNATGLSSSLADIVDAMCYSAWFNDMYATTPTVDDSAYSGTVCGPLPCPTYTAVDHSTHWMIEWGQSDHSTDLAGDFYGYVVTRTDNLGITGPAGHVVLYAYEHPTYSNPADIPQFYLDDLNATGTILVHTVKLQCNQFKNGGAGNDFTIKFCPPSS